MRARVFGLCVCVRACVPVRAHVRVRARVRLRVCVRACLCALFHYHKSNIIMIKIKYKVKQ